MINRKAIIAVVLIVAGLFSWSAFARLQVNNLTGFNIATASVPATSYTNAGGTGDRTATITTSATIVFDEGTVNNLVDGGFADGAADSVSTNAGAVASAYVRFDFGSAKYINEVKWYSNSNFTESATYKWQGSNDCSSFTDISANFSPTMSTTGTADTSMSANQYYDGFRCYQLLGVSGSSNGGTYWREVEFKISG